MKKDKIGKLSYGTWKDNYLNSFTFINFQNLLQKTNKKIVKISCMLALLLSSQLILAQTDALKITVINDEGKPFSGVNIESLTNSDLTVVTDEFGTGILNMEPQGLIKLTFSDMQKVINIKSKAITVQLGKADKNLNLGYGISKPVDEITSSIDIVYSDRLEKSSLNNPLESLYGELSGLMVLQNAGTPWERSPSMYLRGLGTLNDNSILVLVDGFERDMASLALSDIESVSVLKDGADLARYGQRGANGVILVTTKRGAYNSFKVNVSYDNGINFAAREPNFLDSYNYARAVNQASILDGNEAVYSDLDLYGFQTGENLTLLPNVNWFDETLRDFGSTTNVSASFSGGGEKLKYFTSLNYQNERGLFDNTTFDDRYDSQLKYDRFNFRTNLDIDLTNSTKFIVNVAGHIDGRTEPGAGVSSIMNAIYSVPSSAFPVRTPNGEWGGTAYYDNNPVALVSSTGVLQPNGRQIMIDGKITQDLSGWLKGLSAEAALAYDNEVNYSESKKRDFIYESLSYTRNPLTGVINDTIANIYGSETDLNYSKGFKDQLRQASLYGKLNYDTSWNNSVLNTSLMYQQEKRVKNGQYKTYLRQNVIASASYGHKNKYFVDAVLSYSGSSVLPDGDRFGLFPAISAGWVLNREDFLKDNKSVDYLKVRASWGMSGNNIMDPNLYEQAFGSGGGYYFNNNNSSLGGISEWRLASDNLTYENSIKSNLGVDMELFGSLSITLDAFYDIRENILVATSGTIPSLIGVNTPIANEGEVKNRGVETSLLWKSNAGAFNYYVGGNFTFAKNEIVNKNEEFQPYDYLKETGNSIGQQFGLQALGFFENQADIDASPQQLFSNVRPGDIKYKDQNADGVIDDLDIVPIGYAGAYPEIYYGINLGGEYKRFGIDLQFQGVANQTVYLNTKSVHIPLRGNTNITDFSANSWTPETAATATLPRLSLLENENNYRKNDIWLISGDYLKLRRFEVYYKLPEQLISKLNISKAKIYGRGMNVFSIDNTGDVDPESLGVSYPSLASYHVGIKLEF